MALRPKKNRPHEGLDIFASPGTRIYTASSGRVLRVRDGRVSKDKKSRRAGLFVDFLSDANDQGTQYIQRYLHRPGRSPAPAL
jgi:murein DD-endopeptidase MepM/ murein hydrolase activator NlpD